MFGMTHDQIEATVTVNYPKLLKRAGMIAIHPTEHWLIPYSTFQKPEDLLTMQPLRLINQNFLPKQWLKTMALH